MTHQPSFAKTGHIGKMLFSEIIQPALDKLNIEEQGTRLNKRNTTWLINNLVEAHEQTCPARRIHEGHVEMGFKPPSFGDKQKERGGIISANNYREEKRQALLDPLIEYGFSAIEAQELTGEIIDRTLEELDKIERAKLLLPHTELSRWENIPTALEEPTLAYHCNSTEEATRIINLAQDTLKIPCEGKISACKTANGSSFDTKVLFTEKDLGMDHKSLSAYHQSVAQPSTRVNGRHIATAKTQKKAV